MADDQHPNPVRSASGLAQFRPQRRAHEERIDPSPLERVRAVVGLAVIVVAAGVMLAFTAAAIVVLLVRLLTAALG